MSKIGALSTRSPLPEFWQEHREASRNWLALGIMLAAWNLSNDDAARSTNIRPQALQRYDCVSVRAVQRIADEAAPEPSRFQGS